MLYSGAREYQLVSTVLLLRWAGPFLPKLQGAIFPQLSLETLLTKFQVAWFSALAVPGSLVEYLEGAIGQ